MEMKLVVNVRVREHRVCCGTALLEVLKILLSIFGIYLHPTWCGESRLHALKPAQHPG